MSLSRIAAWSGAACLALCSAWSGAARAADIIPYPDSGTVNPVDYTFTAAATGDVTAYFVGRGGASFDETLGMFVNGALSSAGFGLDNQSSAAGQAFDLGHVTAGDTLVFAISVNNPALSPPYVYSDPSLNGPYDGGAGVNHVYSTPYTANPAIGTIPAGTYVGFEDLPATNPPDYNYTDEQYVFTNVGVTQVASVPEPASVAALAFGALALAARSRVRV